MEYPEIIYATEKVESNGIHCLDYRNYDEDVKYIRYDKVKHLLERTDNSDYAKSKSCANCSKLYQCNDVRKHPEWHCEKHDFA